MPGYGDGYNEVGYGQEMMHHGSPAEGILWILVAVIVIALAVRALKHNKHGGFKGWCHSSGLSTLEERYAKGEINTQEFEERRKVLRGW